MIESAAHPARRYTGSVEAQVPEEHAQRPDRPRDREKTGSRPVVLLAGGGTGGHISPGLAIAEAIHRREPGVECLFVCSNREIDRVMLEEAGKPFIRAGAQPFGRTPGQVVRFLRGWGRTIRQAREIMVARDVCAVAALGGFVAAPVVAAARAQRIPVILLNLDAVPGKANRMMARKSATILSTCDLTDPRVFKCERIAMPLRGRSLAGTFGDQRHCRSALGLDPGGRTLLITGASQGSQSLNDLMTALAEQHPEWLREWQVYHLTGHGRTSDLESIYRRFGIAAKVQPFQHRMGLAWGAADLAISRGGANSVAEIAANAVPAIFLPYPHHVDRHQFHNAQPLAQSGGAIICEDLVDPTRNLAAHGDLLQRLLHDDAARAAMRQALDRSRPANGADVVAARLISISQLPARA